MMNSTTQTEASTGPPSSSSSVQVGTVRAFSVDRPPTIHWVDRFLRRTADILVSVTALLILSPLFLVIAVLIKVTSAGPVFYSQVRVGQNRRVGDRRSSPTNQSGPRDRRDLDRRYWRAHGHPFRIHKFRTMVVDAEKDGPQWSSKNDPRITAIGRILRKTRLDETPQFWNVLMGQMALIGPRPERPHFVNQFAETIPDYRGRLHLRPGITGQAQVTLDYDASLDDVEKKLEQDLDYVQKRSISRDLKIVVRTVGVVVTGKGAC